MSKAEPPRASQGLRKQLDQRASELEAEVAAKQQRQPANDPHEMTDQQEESTSKVRAEVRSAEIDRDLAELRDISLAREQIDAGTYGECVDCGKNIDEKRLAAQLTALRCIACQEKFETAGRRG
ncbi:MAG: TraR/DksA family transcriptional regulator [Burkholderiales bacterium]